MPNPPMHPYSPATGLSRVAGYPTRNAAADEYLAVGQMLVLDPREAKIEGDELVVQAVRFSARRFVDDLTICTPVSAPFHGFRDQYTIRASTATLVAPDQVITAGHAAVKADINNTVIVFGRHVGAAFEVGNEDVQWLRIPARDSGGRTQWVRANDILGSDQPKYDAVKKTWSGIDWALISLSEPVEGIEPIPFASTEGILDGVVVSYPLGLPRKVVPARKIPAPSEQGESVEFWTGFGSGASGSPLIVRLPPSSASSSESDVALRPYVDGIVSGASRFHKSDIKQHDGHRCIFSEPVDQVDATPQPVTSIDDVLKGLEPAARGLEPSA